MIGIINYGCGNVGSIQNMFSKIGIWSQIITHPDEIYDKKALVLPGVGAFDNAVLKLKETGFWNGIKQHVEIENKPILGICLGMQLFFEASEEGKEKGLGWFKGSIKKFNVEKEYRIPHIGWEAINFVNAGYKKNISKESKYYFVHAYHAPCEMLDVDVLAYCDYQYVFPAALLKNNITGFQFHPEKSLSYGMELLNYWHQTLANDK
jgi:imidazole glycerol-phosphate synthase subunit HisH